MSEDELKSMPKGYLLIAIAKRTGVMPKEETKGSSKSKKKNKRKKKTTVKKKKSDDDYWLDD